MALDGATLQMVSHGIVTGALFLLVGMLQERAHTREMEDFGGLLRVVPLLGWFFVLAAFASLGCPPWPTSRRSSRSSSVPWTSTRLRWSWCLGSR